MSVFDTEKRAKFRAHIRNTIVKAIQAMDNGVGNRYVLNFASMERANPWPPVEHVGRKQLMKLHCPGDADLVQETIDAVTDLIHATVVSPDTLIMVTDLIITCAPEKRTIPDPWVRYLEFDVEFHYPKVRRDVPIQDEAVEGASHG